MKTKAKQAQTQNDAPEMARATSRTAPRPAATLHLDTLSIKHIRCEEFILEDQETGEARLEIRSNNGEVSIKLWPSQAAGHRSVVILTANDEGGYLGLETTDGNHSTSLSARGLCELTIKGGK